MGYGFGAFLLVVGLVLGAVTFATNKYVYHQDTRFHDVEHLGDIEWEEEHPIK